MKKIPEFKSAKEIAEFWDTHSSAEYWHDMEKCDDVFKRSPLKPLSLKIDSNMFNKIKALAHKKGLNYSSYIRLLLYQGIEHDIKGISY